MSDPALMTVTPVWAEAIEAASVRKIASLIRMAGFYGVSRYSTKAAAGAAVLQSASRKIELTDGG
jgi:hypothetical protein